MARGQCCSTPRCYTATDAEHGVTLRIDDGPSGTRSDAVFCSWRCIRIWAGQVERECARWQAHLAARRAEKG